MKLCSSSILFAIFTVLVFTVWGILDQTSINSTCTTLARDDPNIDYNFCVTSLQAAPGSRCTTLQELGKISIILVLQNVTDTSCYIKQLMKSRAWDPYVSQCLRDCLELFSDAIPSVEQALSCYEAGRFDDANMQISSVMDAASTCDDGFKERRGTISPLTKRNNNTFQLSAIVLSVMHMIQTGSS